jgi:hypothetical protein
MLLHFYHLSVILYATTGERGHMLYMEQDIKSGLPASYTAKELMDLWGMGSTRFYRVIDKIPSERLRRYKISSRTSVYNKEDADRLTPEFQSQMVQRGRPSTKKHTTSPQAAKTVIDVVHNEDLPAVYFMESVQLGFDRAIFPNSIFSWITRNSHAYWLACDPQDRKDIKAVFGVLSVKEDLASRLLQGELLARDIPAADTFAFEPGYRKHTCFITSATALPGWFNSVIPLFQRLLEYWCEQSIQVDKIYLPIPSPTEESAALHIAQEFFFSPLDEYGDNPLLCRLRPMHFNLSPLLQEYQKCIQTALKKEETSMTTTLIKPSATPYIPKVKEELGEQIREEPRDFDHVSQGLFHVDEQGRLVRDGRIAEGLFFREIRSDEDILATLRINASLFGPSKKYTENELVAHRRQWLQKNNDIYRILEVHGRIVGFINVFPFPDEIINRILTGEMKVSDVSLDQLREYKPGQKTNVYLQTIGVHKEFQGHKKRTYGWYLISGLTNMVNSFGKKGIELGSLFTRSDEIDGINLSFGLGLKEHPIPGVEKMIFRLDFNDPNNVFLHEYQQGLEEYKRSHTVKNHNR